MRDWALDLRWLRCPVCRSGLEVRTREGADGTLAHGAGACREVFPVIAGIPRLVTGTARHAVALRHASWFTRQAPDLFAQWSTGAAVLDEDPIVERFDREWERHASMSQDERDRIFRAYFDVVPMTSIAGSLALDAGCGSGRWSVELARRGARVLAVDLGLSIEVAARATREFDVLCIQGDVRSIPVASEIVSLAASLGVLHHVSETTGALREIVRTVRPGGSVLVYVYHSLRNASITARAVFALVDVTRQVLAHAPQPVLTAMTDVFAALVYWPLARTSRLVRDLGFPGLATRIPLSFYADLSFQTMRNDSLDRFGTRLEKRYSREEFRELLDKAGLVDVTISPSAPYWHGTGRRPL